jgi:flavin reductase (DIM6/NTAB) family NADH-FMN oxidoreductase RutF
MNFKNVDLDKMQINPFEMLGGRWALLSAGDQNGFNTMTISWGFVGVMWHKNVVQAVVRPQRYTKEFLDNFELFTVSFFPSGHKDALTLLGKKSGRDGDKIKQSGLTPCFVNGALTFEEASEVFVCRKLFGGQQLDKQKFVDKTIVTSLYPNEDYHYLYIGEIEGYLVK